MYDFIGYFARQDADAGKFYQRLFWVLVVLFVGALYINSRASIHVKIELQEMHACPATRFLSLFYLVRTSLPSTQRLES